MVNLYAQIKEELMNLIQNEDSVKSLIRRRINIGFYSPEIIKEIEPCLNEEVRKVRQARKKRSNAIERRKVVRIRNEMKEKMRKLDEKKKKIQAKILERAKKAWAE